jgi:hypothetical protein
MTTHTLYELATDWNLWRKYIDREATMTAEQFQATPIEERIKLIRETFGPGPGVPTVEEVLAGCRDSNSLCNWPVEGGSIQIPDCDLLFALEAAYNPTMPDWASMVELGDI